MSTRATANGLTPSGPQKRIAKTVIFLTLITVLTKLLGLVREQVVASQFGASALTDAYVSAQFVSNMLDGMIGAAMAATLVPLFTDAKEAGERKLSSVIFTIVSLLSCLYGVESVVLWISAPTAMRLLVPGMEAAALEQGVLLARLCAPLVFLLGLQSLSVSLLNVHKSFVLPSLTALCANIAMLVAAAVLGKGLTVVALTWAIVVGNIVQLVLLIGNIYYVRLPLRLMPFDWEITRQLVAISAPLVLANLVTKVTPFADKYFASGLTPGTISALNYATMLVQMPVGIMVFGFLPVLFSQFAELASKQDSDGMAKHLGRTLQVLGFLLAPMLALVFALARPLVAATYGRGEFDSQAIAATSESLLYYALAIVPLVIGPVLTRVLIANKNSRWQLINSAVSAAVFLLAAWFLSSRMAHRGLALAFSLGRLASLALYLVAVVRMVGATPLLALVRSLRITLPAAICTFLTAWLVAARLEMPVTQLVLGGTAGATAYLAIHFVFRSSEGRWLLETVVSRRGKPGQESSTPVN